MNQTDPKIYVDHVNSTILTNTSNNLRLSNAQKNATNRKKCVNVTSKYYGVSFDKKSNVWRVEVKYQYKKVLSKRYKDEEYAARRYDLYVLFDTDSHKPINFTDWHYDLILEWQNILQV